MAGFVDEFEAGGKQPSLRARCVLVDAEPKVVRRAQAGSGALCEVRAVLTSDASDERDPASAVSRGLLALAGGLSAA